MNKRTSNIEHRTSDFESLIFDVRSWTLKVRRSLVQTFTLVEVVVAIAILAMGVVAALKITATGTSRVNKAIKRWEVQHMLSQAAEYYLIAGPNENIPEDFFPFDGYQASCQVDIPDISEEVETEFRGWELVKLIITVTDSSGDEVGKIEMDKILRSEDVE